MPSPDVIHAVRYPMVFLTVLAADGAPSLASPTAHALLSHLWRHSRDQSGWSVGRYLILPDQVHLFVSPVCRPQMLELWVAAWKSVSARHLAGPGRPAFALWQRDYADRFLDSAETYAEKSAEVTAGVVRAGLAASPEAWPYQGVIHEW